MTLIKNSEVTNKIPMDDSITTKHKYLYSQISLTKICYLQQVLKKQLHNYYTNKINLKMPNALKNLNKTYLPLDNSTAGKIFEVLKAGYRVEIKQISSAPAPTITKSRR